jgi:hypothetical protein
MKASKVRTDEKDVKDTVKKLFEYIVYFNTMVEFQDRILNVNVSQISLIKEIAGFVIPESVRLIPADRRTADLLVRAKLGDIDVSNFNINEFYDLQAHFRKYFRKDLAQDMVNLKDIKVPKSFNDIMQHMAVSVDGVLCVRYDGEPYIPIELDANAVQLLFRKDYWNADADDIIADYLAPVVF